MLPGSFARATNCIFSNNGAHGMNLDGPVGTFTCSEDYNVFCGDDLVVNAVSTSLAANSTAADPVFMGRGDKPSPWYTLGSKASRAYHRASDGGNRGAYQNTLSDSCTVFIVR